ncbi:MAG: hypothetical protein IJY56_03910 [Clostridia bacterium]|nr:hypothetical protein [Clostridia bacterium]
MGLFNGVSNSFKKEGPGVSRGGEMHPFFEYWAILFRKFWSMITVNLLFVAFSIPLLVLSGMLWWFLFKHIGGTSPWYFYTLLSLAPFSLFGPVLAGITKITRDFGRGVPVFVWKDFRDAVKKNFSQSLAFSVVGYILLLLIGNACGLYYQSASQGVIQTILYYVSLAFLIIYLFAQYYVYMMCVTLKLKFTQIFKNAVFLAFLGLVRNLIATVALVVYIGIAVVMFWTFASQPVLYPILFFYIAFLLPVLCGYTISFLSFPVVRKYIIDPYYKANPSQTADAVINDGTDSSPFKNIGKSIEDPSLPEYVYENGKMVPRSVIENVMKYNDNSNNNKDDK